MEFKIENLCGFLIRSKLMTPAEMQAMRQRWQGEAKENAAQTPMFLKWLVAKNYATEYQASLLARGHVDDFFLGVYKILERVGRGRMAGVYKAVHPSGQVVAIKVLPPSRAKNGQTLARFQREARLAVKLKHPHVVRSFQVGETKGVHFLVMEYLEGEPLDEVLQRRKRLPPGEAVRLVHQALLGLQYIHEQGMVHRDLKPANLMLLPASTRGSGETTLKSQVKILDIGLAREFFDENSPTDGAERMELTAEGVLLGTPDYLAPEQARDPRNIDIRADIYSLGCTLYHLLTGQPPFPDKNILNQMIRHATETPKPIKQFNSSLPEGLAQIVDWMMAKQPTQRYPTPARAAQALEAFLMVANEPARPVEESPQLKKFLTSLELSEPAAPAQVPPVMPRGKPASSPNIPAAAKPPESTRKRKRRTGVKVPGADVPAAIPADGPAPIPAASAIPPAALPADAFDVELVDLSVPAAGRGWRPASMRDFLMLGMGMVAMLIVWGIYTLVMLVISWF
ncbi:MAG: protein kinase [Planctomycetes bacterium]|nr:protein kinase [Planctomycetota bacterium]